MHITLVSVPVSALSECLLAEPTRIGPLPHMHYCFVTLEVVPGHELAADVTLGAGSCSVAGDRRVASC